MTVSNLTIVTPDDCEVLAKFLETLATEVRTNRYIAFTGIFVQSGGGWTNRSCAPSRAIGVPEMIGYLFSAMHDLADDSKR